MNRSAVILMALFFLAGAGPAYAYLDPGVGSLFLQALIGGIAAGFFVLKRYWISATSLFRRLFRPGKNRET